MDPSETLEHQELPRVRRRSWRDADIRIFSSASDAARARRPTDLLLLLGSAAVLGILTLPAPGPTSLDSAVSAFVRALPGLLGWFWQLFYDATLGWTLFLLVVVLFARGRKAVLRDLLLAAALAIAGAAVAGRIAGTPLSTSLHAIGRSGPPATYLAVRLAIAAAVIVTASPHLSRPLRYVGRWILWIGALGSIALSVSLPIGVVAALAVGLGSAASVHLVFGSPGGRLPIPLAAAALEDLGVEATDLRGSELTPEGAQLITATAPSGGGLLVKIYGRDAWDGQLLTAAWSSLWYRAGSRPIGLSRLQQVEHEAFVTLLAERAHVPVQPVIAAGLASGRDALLVIESSGRVLATMPPEQIDDPLLASVWSAVHSLHAVGVAHGGIDALHIMVRPDASASLIDFAGSTAAATDTQLFTDRAQVLVMTALLVGPQRAIAVAHAALGNEGITELLPFLQPAAIVPAERRAIKERDWDLDGLRGDAATSAGVDVPKLEPLRRVTWGSLAKVALLILIAYALISAISGVGLANLSDQLREASAGWFWAALLLTPLAQVAQAFSTVGASERPVKLGPAIVLQSAILFLALAVPSSAARVALNVRFFQRLGASATGALAVGLIDSVSGFVVQVLLLLGILLSGMASLNLDIKGTAASISTTLILIVIAVVVIAIVVLLAIPRVRAMIRSKVADASVALRVLHSPRNVAFLFFGNLSEQLIFAVILGFSLRAFGYRLEFAELILVNTVVSLFAGFMPVPGGIGVAEAAYTACFVALGIPQTAALAAAIIFRLATYYLPPIWGAFAMKWLRGHEYV